MSDLAQLQAVYRRYFDAPTLAFARLQVPAAIEREKFDVRPLAAAELAAAQAAIHVAMRRPAEATAQVEAVQKAAAQSALAWDVEGLLWDLKNDAEKARAAYARAAELGSASEHTFYRSAQLAWKAGAADETWRAIAASLERAVAIDPDSARACSYLAEVKVRLNQAKAAEPLARRAVGLEPGRSYHRKALARALGALGRRAEALAEAEHALSVAQSDKERTSAQQLLDQLRSN